MEREQILPMLRHPAWAGWMQAAGRAVVEVEATPAPPRLGWVVPEPGTKRQLRFLTPEALVLAGLSRAAVEQQALENLKARKARWKVAEKRGGFLGFGGKPIVLACLDELAGERLLVEEFLRDAHERLDATRILVAAPTRGLLIAAIADDDELSRALVARVEEEFVDAPEEAEPVSAAVLIVEEGKPKGLLGRRGEPRPARGFPWPTLEEVLEQTPLEVAPIRARPQRPAPAPRPKLALAPSVPSKPSVPSVHAPIELIPPDEDGPALHLLGYVPSARRLDYGCWLVRGQSIPEAEVAALAAQLGAGTTSDGRPLASVRVELVSPELAATVGAPLRALGPKIELVVGDDDGAVRPI